MTSLHCVSGLGVRGQGQREALRRVLLRRLPRLLQEEYQAASRYVSVNFELVSLWLAFFILDTLSHKFF